MLAVATLCLQRQRSTFRAIEADRAAAEQVAARHGLSLPDAMALRDLVGVDADPAVWHAAAAEFAAKRARFGDGLAAVAAAGDAPLAEAALLRGGDDAERAWAAFRVQPEALPGLRFLAMRERFAARHVLRG